MLAEPSSRGVGPPGVPDREPGEPGSPPPEPPGEDPVPEGAAEGRGPDPPPGLPPEIRTFLIRGLFLFPATVGGLWAFTGLGGWDALFLATLLELLPVLAVSQVPLADPERLDRSTAYAGSAGAVLVLGWLSLVLGERVVGLEAMGLGAFPWRDLLVWTVAGVVGGLLLVGVFHLVERMLETEEPGLLRHLLPRTTAERWLFVGVSLSAGLGEELAYRGYVIPVLGGLVGSEWAAAVMSSGIFGFLHAYQGEVGVVRTGLMGFVLAALFIVTGSLWPGILAHAVIDLVGGLVLGPRLLGE